MSYSTLIKAIRQKKFEPVYFFAGEETYYIDLLTAELEKQVVALRNAVLTSKYFTAETLTCCR